MNHDYLLGFVLRQMVNQESLMRGLLLSKRFNHGLKIPIDQAINSINAINWINWTDPMECAKKLFKHRYVLKMQQLNFYQYFSTISLDLKYLAELGDVYWIQWTIEHCNGFNKIMGLINGILVACEHRQRGVVEFLIDHPIVAGQIDLNQCLYSACFGGSREIVDLMISRGANAWDRGLVGACEGGHIELSLLMIEKGASNWTFGFFAACSGENLELIKLMIEKGADWRRKDLKFGLSKAISDNNCVRFEHRKDPSPELIEFIIRAGEEHEQRIKNLMLKKENATKYHSLEMISRYFS